MLRVVARVLTPCGGRLPGCDASLKPWGHASASPPPHSISLCFFARALVSPSLSLCVCVCDSGLALMLACSCLPPPPALVHALPHCSLFQQFLCVHRLLAKNDVADDQLAYASDVARVRRVWTFAS